MYKITYNELIKVHVPPDAVARALMNSFIGKTLFYKNCLRKITGVVISPVKLQVLCVVSPVKLQVLCIIFPVKLQVLCASSPVIVLKMSGSLRS